MKETTKKTDNDFIEIDLSYLDSIIPLNPFIDNYRLFCLPISLIEIKRSRKKKKTRNLLKIFEESDTQKMKATGSQIENSELKQDMDFGTFIGSEIIRKNISNEKVLSSLKFANVMN